MPRVEVTGSMVPKNGSRLTISVFTLEIDGGKIFFRYRGKNHHETISIRALNGGYTQSVEIDGYRVSVWAEDRNRVLKVMVKK
jgi:hypothetical protein